MRSLVTFESKKIVTPRYSSTTGVRLKDLEQLTELLIFRGKEYQHWNYYDCDELQGDIKKMGLELVGGPLGFIGIVPIHKMHSLTGNSRICEQETDLQAIVDARLKATEIFNKLMPKEIKIKIWAIINIDA